VTPAERLLERLEGVTQTGEGRWQARCPAHEDRKPSLTVTEKASGDLLLHCHAGCTNADALAAVDLGLHDLFAEHNGNGHREIVSTYDYTAEDGELLFQVVRFAPKDFRQRRPDGNGGWDWKLGDTRRVPYRLPAIVAAVEMDYPVFIVEGEKDADAITTKGYAATCNPGGAGKWRQEFAEFFRGAHVNVVADRDEPGRKHALAVARSLAGIAEQVHLLEPPTGKDMSEHLAGGGSVGRLEPMASEMPESMEDQGSTLTDFTEIVAKPVRWAWRDRVALAKITALAGRPKIGKGLLYSHLIAQATRGRLDGDLSEPRNVILVTTEDEPGDTLKPRLMAADADLSRVSIFQMGPKDEPIPFRVPQDADELGRRVAQKRAALVVIDPLMEFIDGKVDSHKSHPVRQAVAALNLIAREHGCAVLVILHLNKSASTDPLLRHEGSAAFTQVVRGGLMLGHDPDDVEGEDGNQRVLAVSSSNLAPIAQSLVYRIDTSTVEGDTGEAIQTARMVHIGESDANGQDLLRDHGGDGERGALDDAKDFLEAELADGRRLARDVTRAAEGIGVSRITLKRARAELEVAAERVGEPGVRGGGAWYWSLPIKGIKGDESPAVAMDDPLNANPLTERDSGGSDLLRGSRLNDEPLNPATAAEQAEVDRIQAKFEGSA
jgi:putative DNA primase/helicase